MTSQNASFEQDEKNYAQARFQYTLSLSVGLCKTDDLSSKKPKIAQFLSFFRKKTCGNFLRPKRGQLVAV